MSQLQNKTEPDEQNYITDCNAVQSGKYLPTTFTVTAVRTSNLTITILKIDFIPQGAMKYKDRATRCVSTRKLRVRDLIISSVICDLVLNHVHYRQ
jgi:hypothetical protein